MRENSNTPSTKSKGDVATPYARFSLVTDRLRLRHFGHTNATARPTTGLSIRVAWQKDQSISIVLGRYEMGHFSNRLHTQLPREWSRFINNALRKYDPEIVMKRFVRPTAVSSQYKD